MLVNSIAQNIFESLKKNEDLKKVLSSMFQNDSTLADSLQENFHFRGKKAPAPNLETKTEHLKKCTLFLVKSSEKTEEERVDSGLYSEDCNTNDAVYSSSCHVENKHFKNSGNEVDKSYEEFVADIPLTVAEINVRLLSFTDVVKT